MSFPGEVVTGTVRGRAAALVEHLRGCAAPQAAKVAQPFGYLLRKCWPSKQKEFGADFTRCTPFILELPLPERRRSGDTSEQGEFPERQVQGEGGERTLGEETQRENCVWITKKKRLDTQRGKGGAAVPEHPRVGRFSSQGIYLGLDLSARKSGWELEGIQAL